MKEYRFYSGTTANLPLGTSGASALFTSVIPIRGTIKSFEWKTDTTGSIFLTASGTNRLLYSNVAPSGTGWQAAQPSQFISTAGSPYTSVPHIAFEPLIVAASGIPSGTAAITGQFVVRYC